MYLSYQVQQEYYLQQEEDTGSHLGEVVQPDHCIGILSPESSNSCRKVLCILYIM